ncbi:MAG: UDP-N-acetylmuramoyl-tripeptide--D-alanyl-D-alanine ligase [Saprospiraceae bacterium]|nr:UDP-N-acetylmuramoyl-tripeptide--D-alanyl-D-alanine ligase [Saprospiraceae bacterium]
MIWWDFLHLGMLTIESIYELFSRSSGVSTDTRKIEKNQLFVALRGDHFDGNDYAVTALKNGAGAALVDRYSLADEPGCYYVPNTLSALQKLAHHHRKHFSLPLIGITGTNGKTTTKELIRCVLSQKYHTLATAGNLNNHIGVPLTLLEITAGTEVAIIEMGANHPGEIGWLCNIAAPALGVVTNVGRAHLEGFRTLSNIWDTKMALYRYLDGRHLPVLINQSEPSLHPLEKVKFFNAVRFDPQHLPKAGKSVSFEIRSEDIVVNIITQNEEQHTGNVGLYGEHNVHNILTAISIAFYLEVPVKMIIAGLKNYLSNQNRSQIITRGSNTFYLDAYNANPTSMKMALKFFRNLEVSNKMLILGDMKELGEDSVTAHREILEEISQFGRIKAIILVGPHFSRALSEIGKLKQQIISLENVNQVRTYLNRQKLQDTHVLLKASRSIGLENIL